MKRRICMMMALTLMVTTLAACGLAGGGRQGTAAQDPPGGSAVQAEGKKVHGIINKIDTYLVLLVEDAYQVMDYGEGVTMDGFSEGDAVDVTYTGQLGVDGAVPVVIAIEKA